MMTNNRLEGTVLTMRVGPAQEDPARPGVYTASIISVRLESDAHTEKELCMKIIDKADLRFVDGRLTDADGNVVSPRRLVAEVNELAEVRALTEFVKTNASKIKAPTERVTFTLPKVEAPRLKSEKVAATPLNDEHKAAQEARAKEFIDAQNVVDIDGQLARYSTLARFLNKESVVVDGDATADQFLINPLELDEATVVGIVEEYRDPEIFRLARLVHVIS